MTSQTETQRVVERPKGSNADEWHLFLLEHKESFPFLAVQIAEAIEATTAPLGALENVEYLTEIKARAEGATPAPWTECGIADGPNDNGVDGLIAFRGDEEFIIALADKNSTQPWQDSADMEFIAHAREDVPFLLALISRQQEEIERSGPSLDFLKKPGALVFLDGRNEHGSHVLPSLPSNIPPEYQNELPNWAEEILQAAESNGFKVGDHVWTEWHWNDPQFGDFGRIELDGYWEFTGINVEASHALAALQAKP